MNEYLNNHWEHYDWKINSYTWEIKNANSSKVYTWQEPAHLPGEDEMMEQVVPRLEDKGFFMDVLAWLRESAPRKVAGFLRSLNHPGGVAIRYERMCEHVYLLGFRATDILERRMILGPANKWVKLYFKDFPRQKGDGQ